MDTHDLGSCLNLYESLSESGQILSKVVPDNVPVYK